MSSDLGAASKPPWRIAEQFFRYNDFEIETRPHNDGYVATIRMGFKTRRVFFDPAGRITHVMNLNEPSLLSDPKDWRGPPPAT